VHCAHGRREKQASSACEPADTHRNCCWNSLTTVTRIKTNRIFESSDEALPLCYTLMREVEAVAKAKGLNIPEGTVERLIKECTDVKTGLPSSMMFDNFAGRPMETEVSERASRRPSVRPEHTVFFSRDDQR
jgi:2-dehydropantoate 2-reductase